MRSSTRLLECYLSANSSSRGIGAANGTYPQQQQHHPQQHHQTGKGLLSELEVGRSGAYGLQISHQQQQQQQSKGQQGPGISRLGPSSTNGPAPEDHVRQQMKRLQVRCGSVGYMHWQNNHHFDHAVLLPSLAALVAYGPNAWLAVHAEQPTTSAVQLQRQLTICDWLI
jgi:hypothetical protein